MDSRTVGNTSGVREFNTEKLTVRGIGRILELFSTGITPKLYYDTSTSTLTINGDLTVNGEAEFTHVEITSIPAGTFIFGDNNAGDAMDLGYAGMYNDGTEKYAGVVRDASDAFKRITFFQDITTPPEDTVSGINSSTLAPTRMSRLFVLEGSAANPSVTFDNGSYDNGFYLTNEGGVAVSTSGSKRVEVSDSSMNVDVDMVTSAGVRKKIDVIAGAAVTLDNSHDVIELSNEGDVTVTLPACADHAGRSYLIIKTGSIGIATVNTAAANEYIDDNVTTSIQLNTQFDKLQIICNGNNRWYSV